MRALLLTCLVLGVCATVAAAPQQPSPTPPALPDWLHELVKKQFGPAYTIVADFATPVLTGDLNEDGIQDVVIVGRCKNPLVDEQDFHYKVVDPHHAYFGFGNPKETWEFNLKDPLRNMFLLVIHGAGDDAWRAETPKEKFVLINVPFDRLGLGRVLYKKKTRPAISAEETSVLTSAVFWDGKKYRWEPNTALSE